MKRLLLIALALAACHRADSGRDLSSVDGPALADAAESVLAYSVASAPRLAAFTPTPGCCAASSTGSATGANQLLQLAQETAINGKLPALVGGKVPVDVGTVTVTGGLTDTQLRASAVPVTVAAGATSAKQDTGNVSLASIDSKTPALVGGRQPVDGSGVTQPISAASLPLPSGAATSTLQGGGLPAALVGGRLDVNIGAGTVTITPSGTQAVSSAAASQVDGHSANIGTLADASSASTLTGILKAIKAAVQGTLAISAASLPLPTLAATSTKQPALGTAGTPSTDVISIQGETNMTPLIAVGQPAGTTDGLARDASVVGILVAQASNTSAQTGPLCQGAATTAAPTYVTGKTYPMSLTTAGGLRVDGSGVTQPVSIATAPIVTAGTTPALTSVALTTTGAQVWAASAAAKVRKLYNPTGNAVAYCIYYDGSNNVTSEGTAQFVIQPGQVWEMPNYNGIVEYTGIVRCALATSTGNINATQVT